MKLRLLIPVLFFLVQAHAQSFGPSKGFPSDPVISAAYYNGTLYLGTQGSGVFTLREGRIVPAENFAELASASIYGFDEKDGELVPKTKGQLQQ